MSTPDVSVILCTADRAPFLRDTLASLARVQVPHGWTCELLVVDNAPSDATTQAVQEAALPSFSVRLLCEARRGLSFARNTGLAAARGEVLLFTDDDLRFPSSWLADMAGPLRAGRADALAGGIRIAPHLERDWLTPGHMGRLASTEALDPAAPGELVGANMALHRRVLDKVPAFDPELGAGALGFGEDTLFAWQTLEAGFHIAAAFDNGVEHHFDPYRLTRANLLAAAEKTGRAQGYLHWHWLHRHLPLPRLRLLACLLRLTAWRISHLPILFQSDRVSQPELDAVRAVALLRQYLLEKKRPRRYDRRGLKLKGADASTA